MPWLALATPQQAAAGITPALTQAATVDTQLSSVLGNIDGTRWPYFAGTAEVIDGLFLSQLNGLRNTGACDSVSAIIASSLAASSGITGNSNHPPLIQSTPVTRATEGQAYHYPILATDPDGDALSYRIVSAPTGIGVDANGLVTWSAPVEGNYSVTLRVDDGKAYTDQSYTLAVAKAGQGLQIQLSLTPQTVKPGDTLSVTLIATGAQNPLTLSLSNDGQALTLDANGQAQLTAGSKGTHHLIASATDGVTTVTKDLSYTVGDPADQSLPVATIASPTSDAEITAPVDVIGSASGTNLAYYQLLLRPAGTSDSAWVEIGRGTQSVDNGKLGTLDPTVYANGLYQLGLLAVDANGHQTSTAIPVEFTRNLKIGQFSISFLDLQVNAVGIPITVTRTYDTRRKADNLDFGYGWSVDYQNVQLRTNMTIGLGWSIDPQQLQLCLRPIGKRKVDITLPDGSMQRFEASNAQECGFGQVPPVDVQFTALPGTTSSLQAINIPDLLTQGGDLVDSNTGDPWNPTDFQLTTDTGYIYTLKAGVGIVQIKDPYGNTLSYGPNGIIHSNGQSVAFTRDAQGRITAVTDPQGKRIRYAYDANGNLIQVTDRMGLSSKFEYNNEHGLTSYTDPRGS